MRCNTCHDYIARGKKFNARKETVEGEEYLGLKIFRFYFRCPVCMQEITYKTDPKSFDYVVESGATPNFKALKLAQQQAIKEQKAIEEEEKLNPVKMLENRTLASRREMENLEALEDLQVLNHRSVEIDHVAILLAKKIEFDEQIRRQEEEDEQLVQKFFGAKRPSGLATIPESDDESDRDEAKKDEKDEEEGEEITEEIGSLLDLYPNLKAEFDNQKTQDKKNSTDLLTMNSSSKPASKLQAQLSSLKKRKRTITHPAESEANDQRRSRIVRIWKLKLSKILFIFIFCINLIKYIFNSNLIEID